MSYTAANARLGASPSTRSFPRKKRSSTYRGFQRSAIPSGLEAATHDDEAQTKRSRREAADAPESKGASREAGAATSRKICEKPVLQRRRESRKSAKESRTRSRTIMPWTRHAAKQRSGSLLQAVPPLNPPNFSRLKVIRSTAPPEAEATELTTARIQAAQTQSRHDATICRDSSASVLVQKSHNRACQEHQQNNLDPKSRKRRQQRRGNKFGSTSPAAARQAARLAARNTAQPAAARRQAATRSQPGSRQETPIAPRAQQRLPP